MAARIGTAMSSSRAPEKFSLLRLRSTRFDNNPAAEARQAAAVQNRLRSKPGAADEDTARLAASEISIDSRWFRPNIVTAWVTPTIGLRGA